VVRAVGLLSGINTVAVLTQPVSLAPTRSLVVVDASTAPFATAWNLAFTDAARHVPSHRLRSPWPVAPAP
jgi:hypothetical protein